MVFTTIDLSLAPSNQVNILDNGSFEIWQRGTSFTNPANGVYTADRWYTYKSTTTPATANVSQVTSPVDSGVYALDINISATGTSAFQFVAQDVENYQAYFGKTVTFSIRINTTLSNVLLQLQDSSGSVNSSAHPGDGTYHTLTVTKTISSSTTFLTVVAGCLTVAATGNIYIDSAMLVSGANAGTFVSLPPQVDLARCQRYFQTLGGTTGDVISIGSNNSTTSAFFVFYLPVVMRIAPTMTINNPTNWTVGNNVGTPIAVATLVNNGSQPPRVGLSATVSSGLVSGNAPALSCGNTNASVFLSSDI